MTWLWPSHRQAPSPVSLPSCSPGGGPTSPRPAWWRRSGQSHPGPPRYHWRGRVSQVLSVLVSCFVTPRLPSPPSSPLSLPCCSLKSFSPLNALAFKPAVCKGKWWALIGLDSHDTRYDMTWPLFPCLFVIYLKSSPLLQPRNRELKLLLVCGHPLREEELLADHGLHSDS